MRRPDEKAIEQHEWVLEEWFAGEGIVESEHYCEKCYQIVDYTKPIGEQLYSDCPEYEGDDDGQDEDDSDSE